MTDDPGRPVDKVSRYIFAKGEPVPDWLIDVELVRTPGAAPPRPLITFTTSVEVFATPERFLIMVIVPSPTNVIVITPFEREALYAAFAPERDVIIVDRWSTVGVLAKGDSGKQELPEWLR